VQVVLTATNTVTCCAGVAGASITPDAPAVPGETIILYATGLGLITPEEARLTLVGRNGFPYQGPAVNSPMVSVSATAASTTGTIISAAMQVGQIGVYEIVIELNNSVTPNPQAQFTISQSFNTSNIVTVPIAAPPQQ